ncbi:hypothetical protein Avbf_16653 [Armadillidium vulgare]|nr:hypothetical protein Avbf_16653 [Armadillidium vulgare]
MKVENENDMMLGILQEEERSFEDSENFSVKLICIYYISLYFNLSYTKRNQKFLLYIGKFVLKISNSQPLLKSVLNFHNNMNELMIK